MKKLIGAFVLAMTVQGLAHSCELSPELKKALPGQTFGGKNYTPENYDALQGNEKAAVCLARKLLADIRVLKAQGKSDKKVAEALSPSALPADPISNYFTEAEYDEVGSVVIRLVSRRPKGQTAFA